MKPLDDAEKERHMFRSLLYMPASSERFVAKAHERGADAIILDLEDSVASSEKERARSALAEAVPSVSRNGAKAFVRINAEPELMFADAEAACRAGALGIFVPKTRRAADLVRLDEHLDKIERGMLNPRKTLLVPMIEDAAAVLDARILATATSRTLGLITGGEDLATAMGAEPTPEMLRFPKLLVHLAAKAVSVLSFGLLRSVADYRDIEGIKRAAQEARDFGFDGASCVHPSVVAILNETFAASAEEIDRATRLIAAYDQSVAAGQGACVFEGKMIDAPVVARARALLAKWSGRQKTSQAV
jgi:citrate lyase subunit beta / citryl-CoA lyase